MHEAKTLIHLHNSIAKSQEQAGDSISFDGECLEIDTSISYRVQRLDQKVLGSHAWESFGSDNRA